MEEAVLETRNRKKGVTATNLKIIAMVAMFIDHTAAIVLNDYLSHVIPMGIQWTVWFKNPHHKGDALVYIIYIMMRLIGRFGFPLFAFLIVEGFMHTSNVKKYALRLGAFALISELPFNLGFSSRLFNSSYQNVFFTLTLGLLCLASMQFFSEKFRDGKEYMPFFYVASLMVGPAAVYYLISDTQVGAFFPVMSWPMYAIILASIGVVSIFVFALLGTKWTTERKNQFAASVLSLLVFCAIADFLRTDYSAGGVLTIAVMYFFRKNRKLSFGMGCGVLTLMTFIEATAFFMMIPVAKYNGKKGTKMNKYVFYAFYPVHIGLLYLVALLLGFTTFVIK